MSLSLVLPSLTLIAAAIGGVVAYLIGAPTLSGVAVGFLVGVSPVLFIGVFASLLSAWRPERPTCRCGRCRSGGYEFIGPAQNSPELVYEYRCPACQRKYRQKGGRFWERLQDGTEIPFMRVSSWGRWRKDDADSAPSSETLPRRG
jgi:hypothetical protein